MCILKLRACTACTQTAPLENVIIDRLTCGSIIAIYKVNFTKGTTQDKILLVLFLASNLNSQIGADFISQWGPIISSEWTAYRPWGGQFLRQQKSAPSSPTPSLLDADSLAPADSSSNTGSNSNSIGSGSLNSSINSGTDNSITSSSPTDGKSSSAFSIKVIVGVSVGVGAALAAVLAVSVHVARRKHRIAPEHILESSSRTSSGRSNRIVPLPF
ncbi:hypothetical protein Vretimale_12109 [Volvox reticuliferus]|uniref:Uncharacterized protein n=1 Tax=Volvox reticuliferus TaxID=1737510 RepID=A0A8J4FQL5_9CHLO|nr:hypothetical protein Vretifemale_9489 [Volvox reticuliferus]GIM08063.1 hypothetical protein Vretimale_12109 [Volvox reticuliferus]